MSRRDEGSSNTAAESTPSKYSEVKVVPFDDDEGVYDASNEESGFSDGLSDKPFNEAYDLSMDEESGFSDGLSEKPYNDGWLQYSSFKHWWNVSVRKNLRSLVKHPYFDRCILLFIALSSILMAMSDYKHVDGDNNLVADGSLTNTIILQSEIVFTVVFCAEFVAKVIALGACKGRDSYFKDYWNWLDFLVVLFSLLSFLDSIPNIKVFRTFRVLRPLKSIKSFPVLASIVVVVLKSLSQMRDISIVIIFLFLLFGIVGLQFYVGPYLHTRCRLTEWPVLTTWNSSNMSLYNTAAFEEYRCLSADVPIFNYPGENPELTMSTSPWNTPHPECYWPIQDSDERFCTWTYGLHVCPNGEGSGLPENEWTYCGSNYDGLGNARFDAATAFRETYIKSLGFGVLNFDNIGHAFLDVFLIITANGWTDITYLVMESIDPISGAIYGVLIILFGSFFILQLIIATLENSLVATEEHARKENEKKLRSVNTFQAAFGAAPGSPLDPAQKVKSSKSKVKRRFSFMVSSKTNEETGENLTYTELAYKMLEDHDKPELNWFRRQCKHLVDAHLFQVLVTALIVVNTVVMAMDRYPIEVKTYNMIEAITWCLTLFFVCEMIAQLLANGIIQYFKDPYQQMDFVIVSLSVVDLILSPPPLLFFPQDEAEQSGGSLSALRSLRLLRFLRLFRSKTFKVLLYKIGLVVVSLKSFMVILFLYAFIMALIGMQFFANRFRFDENGDYIDAIGSEEWLHAPEQPRANFDNFSQSLLIQFQFLTMDNWNLVMYDCGRALGPAAMLYVVFCLVAGSFLLLNMFLAMLIHNFNTEVLDSFIDGTAEAQEAKLDKLKFQQAEKKNKQNKENKERHWILAYCFPKEINDGDSSDEDDDSGDDNNDDKNNDDKSHMSQLSNKSPKEANAETNKGAISISKSVSSLSTSFQEKSRPFCPRVCCPQPKIIRRGINGGPPPAKKGDLVFQCVKAVCKSLTGNPWFENSIMFLIVVSSITLALDNPLHDPDSQMVRTLFVFDVVLTSIFTVEMITKMIAFTIKGYFSDSWNYLDFFVVLVSIISLAGSGNEYLAALGPLRALRALRPIRLVNRLPKLKILVTALVVSGPAVCQIGAIFILVYLIFAIFFTSFLKGQLRSCQGDLFDTVIGPTYEYNELLTYPLSWVAMTAEQQSWFGPNSSVDPYLGETIGCTSDSNGEPCCSIWAEHFGANEVPTSDILCKCWQQDWSPITDFRFDNALMSMITLFVMGTNDNWSEIVYEVSDSRGIGMQPIKDYSYVWYYVFIIFMLVGSFLFVQLFVGVIVSNFEASSKKIGNMGFLTVEQAEWAKTKRIVITMAPKKKYDRPEDPIRAVFYDLCQHPLFDSAITLCIILQVAILSSTYFGQSDEISMFQEYTNLALACIFCFELIIKLIGLGVKEYFQVSWNILDFCIVVGSIAGFVNYVITGNNIGLVVNCVRVVRLARLIRLFKGFKSMRRLMATIVLTLPGIANITCLLLLVMYIFAVVGVGLFAKVGYINTYQETSDFRSFGMSFLSIFRYGTCENWSQVMYDLTKSPEGCVNDPQYNDHPNMCGFHDTPDCEPLNGCGSNAAFFFFIFAIFLINFVFLSVFVSVIISSYNDANESSIRPEDFQAFATHWSHFDPAATCFVHITEFEQFTSTLFAPFGFNSMPYSHRQYLKRVGKIKICKGNKVHFSDAIIILSVAHYERKVKWDNDIHFDTSKGEESKSEFGGSSDDVSSKLSSMKSEKLSSMKSEKLSSTKSEKPMTSEKSEKVPSLQANGSFPSNSSKSDEANVAATPLSSSKRRLSMPGLSLRPKVSFVREYELDYNGDPMTLTHYIMANVIVKAWMKRQHFRVLAVKNADVPAQPELVPAEMMQGELPCMDDDITIINLDVEKT